MSGLLLKNITKSYGEVTAVKDFNLAIQDKEFVVFVGPSGCGKSTTLRMIAGLEEITSGELYIDDRLVNEEPPKDRDIAMVFQNYALYPHLNVYENMGFSLRFRKCSKQEADRRIREAAKILDIEHLLHRKPKELSGGQRQRVALGRAIVREPKVFLMDEPLSNLDAKLRTQMRTEISKLHQRLEATIIYVTHDQVEAMTMGTRIVVMKDGIIQQAATPEEVYNFPANIFVAGFIGSPAMNLIEGTVTDKDSHIYFIGSGLKLELTAEQGKKIAALGLLNKEIILGIRPENFKAEGAYVENHQNNALEIRVDIVENMGAEYYLYFNIGGKQDITARVGVGSLRIQPGSKMKIAVEMEKIHFFDKETRQRI